jgi:hypothetical protein
MTGAALNGSSCPAQNGPGKASHLTSLHGEAPEYDRLAWE